MPLDQTDIQLHIEGFCTSCLTYGTPRFFVWFIGDLHVRFNQILKQLHNTFIHPQKRYAWIPPVRLK